MPADLFYRVQFTIGPVQNPSAVGVRIAELVAVLKRDDTTEVQVRILPLGRGDDDRAT